MLLFSDLALVESQLIILTAIVKHHLSLNFKSIFIFRAIFSMLLLITLTRFTYTISHLDTLSHVHMHERTYF